MRSLLSLLLLAVFARAQSPEERTKQALDLVLARKYDAFYAHFSPEMKKAISLAEYSSQGDRILEALGKPVKIGTPRSQQMKEATTVTIPLEGSGVALNFIVSWNASQQIQGTWFLAPPPASHSQYEPASYSKPDTFAARDVTVGDDQWKLPGTLLVPKG